MYDALTILCASILLTTAIALILKSTTEKDLKNRDEYRIGLIGALIFMFVSWLTMYIANIHPFVKPEFKKERKPEYFKD